MLAVLLTILKVIGIIVLALISLLVFLLILVLFVPVRYRIKGYRKIGMESPVYVRIKVTWLIHIVRVLFAYPEAAYVKVKVLFFTVFNSSKMKEKESSAELPTDFEQESNDGHSTNTPDNNSADSNTASQTITAHEEAADSGTSAGTDTGMSTGTDPGIGPDSAESDSKTKKSWKTPFIAIRDKIKNIWYTILKIYDKIKDTVFNIRYYIDVIKSDEFKEAFSLCSRQLKRIFKSIRPRQAKVNLAVGMKDPRQTGQILELYSILYPLIGNNVFIMPDFDQELTDNRIEGDFYFKGRISVHVLLRAAWKVYRDKNIRKIIKLLKREGT